MICEKHRPDLTGVPTMGLSEPRGVDIKRLVRQFREDYPRFAAEPPIIARLRKRSPCWRRGGPATNPDQVFQPACA